MFLSTLAIMPMTMVREAWTDERLDDLKEHMDEGFREVRADVRSLKSEVGEVRSEVGEVRSEVGKVREGLGEVKAEIKGLNRTLQIGFGLMGTFLVALVGLIGTQL
jgi:peptidoglycan hydrolase CwlO-like protein